ncbi:MAG: pilin [Patescibacteria group bacterium]|nr:pilin [Patescibacteria group bacterium]
MINFIQKAIAANPNVPTETDLRNAGKVGDYITLLYKWVLPFAAGLAVLMIIYAGYLYITSQGNPDNIKQAKDYIIGALVGLALIILAGVILKSVIGV